MAYTPDPRPRLAKATRFFARLVSFDIECPKCGAVYQIRHGNSKRTKVKSPNWDPTTARFTCTNQPFCDLKVYVLGILAWPLKGSPGVASIPPKDQIPNPRQLAGLRAEGGGYWMGDSEGLTLKQPHTTNLTVEQERPIAEREADDDEDEAL